LKNIVNPSMDFDENGCMILVLVILLFPVLRIKNFNLIVDFVDTIHNPMCIVDHRYEYLLEKLISYKNDIQMNCKRALEYRNAKNDLQEKHE
jgi:hypothetical protein